MKQAFPFVLGLGRWLTPVPAGLTASAWHLFAVFVSAISSVLAGSFPLLTSTLLAVAGAVLTGTVSPVKAFAGFANASVLLVVTAFLVAHPSPEALWAEIRGVGVSVSCLVCGPVNTAFFDRSGSSTTLLYRMLPRARADRVAQQAWEGLRRGRRIIVPDLCSRVLLLLMAAVPRGPGLRLLHRLLKRR